MKLIANTLIAAAALAAASAHAEGLYIGGSVGGSHYKGTDFGATGVDRTDTAGKLYGGYSFTPNFALEAGYVDLGKFKSDSGDFKASGVFLDAVGTVPLGYNFSAIGRLGVVNGKLDTPLIGSDRGTNYKVGAGVEYTIDKNLGVRGEWEHYRFDAFGTKEATDMYTVGVNYRF